MRPSMAAQSLHEGGFDVVMWVSELNPQWLLEVLIRFFPKYQ